MEFGSQETFDLIKYEIVDNENTDLWNTLYDIIRKDAKIRLSGYGMSKEDMEDIIQEVSCKIFKKINAYAENSVNKSVSERNSWFNTIVDCTRIDYWRKNHKEPKPIDEDFINNSEAISDPFIESEEHQRLVNWLFSKLENLITIETDPQNILAFIEARIINGINYGSSRAKPREIIEEFDGVELYKVYEIIFRDIEVTIGEQIPNYIKLKMTKKIKESPRIFFQMSAKNISDKCNWIENKIKSNTKKDN